MRNVKWFRGATLDAEAVYEYTASAGNATITGVKASLSGSVSIPSFIGNLQVSAIAGNALRNCSAVTDITIPATVTSIGVKAFPSRVASLTVTSGNPVYYSQNNVVIDRNRKEVVAVACANSIAIPSGVQSIAAYVGAGAGIGGRAGAMLDIPEGVTDIGEYAFSDGALNQATTVSFPSTLKRMGNGAFTGNLAFTANIPSFARWCEIDFGESMFTDPGWDNPSPGIYTNGCYAGGYQYATNVVIPDGTGKVGSYALSGWGGDSDWFNKPQSVVVPSSVTNVHYSLFNKAGWPKNFYFEGDAPILSGEGDVGSGSTIHVKGGSKGWGDVPGLWNGIQTRYEGEVQFAVVLDPCGGSLAQNSFVATNGRTYGTLPTPLRNGYAFKGWFSEPVGGKNISQNSVAGDMAVLYAQWEIIEYSIAYTDTFGFANSNPISYTVEDEIVFSPLLGVGDKIFAKWNIPAIPRGSIGDKSIQAIWVKFNVADGVLGSVELNGVAEITVPVYVSAIGNGAFLNCEGLASVLLPESVESIGDYAFCNCRALESINFPPALKSVGRNAFENCERLNEAVLPDGTAEIGVFAFSSCTSMTNLHLSTSLTNIGYNAFSFCTSLVNADIPIPVKSIGYGAFNDCWSLKQVVFAGDAPSIGNAEVTEAFDRVGTGCIVYIPRSASGYDVVNGKWQGMTVEYYDISNVGVGGKGVVVQTGSGYAATANDGETLTEADFTFAVAREAYVVTIAPDGKSATVTLAAPALAAADGEKDGFDPTGFLATVNEDEIAAKPSPCAGESVGALPVKTYPGLYYQASWGNDIGNMMSGEKVQADGDSLYLGVIRQTGGMGFYKVTVSEQ